MEKRPLEKRPPKAEKRPNGKKVENRVSEIRPPRKTEKRPTEKRTPEKSEKKALKYEGIFFSE